MSGYRSVFVYFSYGGSKHDKIQTLHRTNSIFSHGNTFSTIHTSASFSEEKASGKLDEQLSKQNEQIQADANQQADPGLEVAVYRTSLKHMEKLPLETYVTGVVAAEMPADFELEALKAQALTARTYIIKQKLIKGPGRITGGR